MLPGLMDDKMHELFMRKTAAAYAKMNSRIKERRSKTPGRRLMRRSLGELAFTLNDLRQFTKGLFGPDWVTRCCYCNTPISLEELNYDHKIPLARGGPLSIDNLGGCCGDCNRLKGKLMPDKFLALMDWIDVNLPGDDGRDLRARLRGQVRFLRNFNKKSTTPPPAAVQPQQEETF